MDDEIRNVWLKFSCPQNLINPFNLKIWAMFFILFGTINIHFAIAQVRDDNRVHFSADKSAVFPGGMNNFYLFLRYNFHYSGDAKGRIYIQFIVERDGSLDSLKVVRKVSPEADKEAMRVMLLSPNWDPGIINGKPVRQKYVVPISVDVFKQKPQPPPNSHPL